MMIATQSPSTIQLSQHQQVFFFNGNTHNRDLPVSRSQSIHMLGRRRDRIGCCSTRSRHHHLNHATILIQEHRHRLLVLRRQYNINSYDSNSISSNSNSLDMIVEEEGEEEDQLMKDYIDEDDDDTITTTNTTLSSSSSLSSSTASSSSSLSSSFSSPPSTILSGTDFYLESQRKSLSSLAYYY